MNAFFQELAQLLPDQVLFVDQYGVVFFANKRVIDSKTIRVTGRHWSEILEVSRSAEGWQTEPSDPIDPAASRARFKNNPNAELTLKVLPVLGHRGANWGCVIVLSPISVLTRSQVIDEAGDILAVILGSASRIERAVRAQPGVDSDAFNQTARIKQYCMRLSDLVRKALG